MDSDLKNKIATLRLYLCNLPDNLPLPSLGHSSYRFESFAPDPDWVSDVGEEGAVNRELEVLLGSRMPRSLARL